MPRPTDRPHVFTLVGITVATAVALTRGGRASHAAAAEVLWPGVLVTAVALDLVTRLGGPGGPEAGATLVALLVLQQALIMAVVIVNLLRPGMPLVALGAGLNAAAVLANSGMPVSGGAVRWLGGSPERLIFADSHHLMTAATRLDVLTDLVPIPGLGTVVSIGDVVVLVGLAIVIDDVLRPPGLAFREVPRSA